MARRMSFLGATPPQVKGLDDIPAVESRSELHPARPVVLTVSRFSENRKGGYWTCFSEATPMDRDQMIESLSTDYGMDRALLENADEKLLAEMIRVYEAKKHDEENP